MDVLVVGAGSMGRWVGEILQCCDVSDSMAQSDNCSVFYYDERPDTARRAADETGGEMVTEPSSTYEVVCIAVPIPAATAAIAAHADRATRAVLDVTGTMKEPVRALREHAPDVERCSLHPLFSPESEPGNVPMVVEDGGPITSVLREALEARGNRLFETTPEEHDEMMTTVQAKAHAAILAYGLAGEAVPDRYQTAVSDELSDLVRHVARGDPRVYADIQQAFGGADDIATAATQLAGADEQEFQQLYEQISETHR